MRVAMDATPLTLSTGGIARYTRELSLALAREFASDEVFLVSDQPFARALSWPPNVRWGAGARTGPDRRWWLWGVQREMARLQADVFHGTHFEVPLAPLRPSVATLHDLSPWMEPAWHTNADRVRRRAPLLVRLGLATMIVTPSEAVRREAIERFRIHPSRITAVPLAASSLFRPVAAKPRNTPYFLFAGTLEPRKNLGMLVEAWREVRRRHPVDLVLVGRRREDFTDLAPETGLDWLGEAPDEDLAALYSGAVAFVYPSLYEGFGLPVLEAMQCGAAVITSKDPAITEVAGGAAVQVDARDTKGWVEAMAAAVTQPDLLSAWRERSRLRASGFGWARTARLTREVYVEAIRRFRG